MFTTDSEFPFGDNPFPKLFCLGITPDESQPDPPCPPQLLEAFEDATGWTIAFKESGESRRRRAQPGMNSIPQLGQIEINDMSIQCPPRKPAHRGRCDRLASAIDGIFQELQQTRFQLVQARAELATQVPVTVKPEQNERLVQLLSGLLQTAVNTIEFDRAELHLLDDAAEYLHVRCSVGEPEGLNSGKRLLSDCPSDIDALSGNAIVINSPSQLRTWNVPRDCHSAVCIPVASLTNIIGTLWLYSDNRLVVSDSEINILEIIAGRIAAELEREAVIRHALPKDRSCTDQPDREKRDSENLEAVVDAPFDGWKLSGRAGQAGDVELNWRIDESEQIRISGRVSGSSKDAEVAIDPFTGGITTSGDSEQVKVWSVVSESECEPLGPLKYLLPGQQILVTVGCDSTAAAQLAGSDSGTTTPWLSLTRS